MEAVQQFVIDHGSGNDDFRAPQADAFNLAPLVHRQASQALSESRYLRAGDDQALAASILAQIAGSGGEGVGGSRGGNHVFNFCGYDARSDAVDFASDESLQPFKFALSRRIVTQEFAGKTVRNHLRLQSADRAEAASWHHDNH